MLNFDYIINLLKFNPEEPIIFITGFFLWFFVIFIFFYSVFSKVHIARLLVLVSFSYYFYYKAGGDFIALLFISSLAEYFLSRAIYKSEKKSFRGTLFALILLLNIGVLVYFKYSNFFAGIYNDIFNGSVNLLKVSIPVGISFFTFQKLGYSIDIFRKNGIPANSILEFFAFVSFFPSVQSGPILRTNNFIPQLSKKKVLVTTEDTGKAVFLIISGMIKKIVISDYISLNFVDRVFDNPALYSGFENLTAVYGYALQIYCDFSGYSDIAIGIALLIGFKVPPNFNAPYKSISIKEFWQRWHISLSFWLRDYVFFPLAYKVLRLFKNKKFLSLRAEIWSYHTGMLVTMFVCGLWHGASWTFVVWGVLHGIGISLERIIKTSLKFKSNIFSKAIGAFITFNFVVFAWILFRVEDFAKFNEILTRIFSAFDFFIIPGILAGYKEVFVIILIGYALHFLPDKIGTFTENFFIKSPLFFKALYLVFAIWVIVQIKSADIQPFIYFNF
ncbi:MAG: MBOAT family protein [Ignavibacteria bacterium]|nr:MBOAT family protein [Ignavibacteria bacterium]